MISELFSMEGRVCVVTGGSRGLGRTMAEVFLEAGAARVYVTARSADAVEAAAAEMTEAYAGDCIPIAGDLADLGQVRSLAAQVAGRETHVDVLVNNAGRGWLAPFEQFPEKGWDKVMDLNVKSPFFLTRELLPLLTARSSAEWASSVVNVGSIAGISANPTDTFSYNASKSAVHQVTRNLALELAPRHVRVNAIAPGRFHSAMTEYAKADPAAYEAERKRIPQHRWGEPGDIAGVALMLASRAGAFITGQIVVVDGGTTLVM